jgi:hypothetical protein
MLTPRDALEDIAFGIFHHHKFDVAARSHIANLARWRSGLGGFNKVISSHARSYIVNSIIYLHFEAEGDSPDQGASFERLLKFCGERGHCGPRVLRTVLMLALNSGHLSVARGRRDRRLKIFHPTEKLLAEAQRVLGHNLECLDLLVDDGSLAPDTPRDQTFVRLAASTAGRRYFEEGLAISEYYEDLHALMRLDGGFATVAAMSDAQLHGRSLPGYKEIASKFRFSASQSRKILKRAETLDLVTFSADGRVTDASGLARTFKWAIARELALYAKYTLDLTSYFAPPRVDQRGAVGYETAKTAYRAASSLSW